MSKVSDQFHKLYHTHHDRIAMTHATMMGHHEEGTPEHTHHKIKHESHVAMRDFHKACMEKATTDEMNKVDSTVPASLEDAVRVVFLKMFGNTLVPTNVSGVAPTRPGVTAVPRAGEKPVPVTPNVPLEFAKLVAVDEDP
jgi:hypothetical protein